VGRLATDSGVFPLYEVENGRLRITRKFGALKPVREYFKVQGRFAHLTEAEIDEMQARVRADWAALLERESATPTSAPRAPA
jgi:pyruvate ferredoxin oxidoreductase beta subunit